MNGAFTAKDVSRVPLFDRLIDEEPYREREAVPLRTFDRESLHESIRRELARLLSTRCPWTGDRALTQARTALDYGLPDLDQGGRALVGAQRPRLARLIRETILAYEPRLANVFVEVLDVGENGPRVVVSLEAEILSEDGPEPIALTLPLGNAGSHNDG